MSILCDTLKNSYINWLNTVVEIKDLDGVLEITSPILDRHLDFLQIYVISQGDKLLLTDDGYTIGDLLLSGCDIRASRERNELFHKIITSHEVSLSDKSELCVEANVQTFPLKLHMLLQTMVTVNDIFLTT